jgi:hypothetical protein
MDNRPGQGGSKASNKNSKGALHGGNANYGSGGSSYKIGGIDDKLIKQKINNVIQKQKSKNSLTNLHMKVERLATEQEDFFRTENYGDSQGDYKMIDSNSNTVPVSLY